MQEIRIHGYGGQGTVTMAELLASAGLGNGRRVQTLPFFGVERRGAPVRTSLRFSSGEILLRSQVYTPSLLVLLSEKLLTPALKDGASQNMRLLINKAGSPRTEIYTHSELGGMRVYTIDAAAIAGEANLYLTGQPLVNIPMCGAAACLLDVPEDLLIEAINRKWPGAKPNERAASEGYKSARIALSQA